MVRHDVIGRSGTGYSGVGLTEWPPRDISISCELSHLDVLEKCHQALIHKPFYIQHTNTMSRWLVYLYMAYYMGSLGVSEPAIYIFVDIFGRSNNRIGTHFWA